MALEWIDKVDNQDVIQAKDVNDLAHAIMENEHSIENCADYVTNLFIPPANHGLTFADLSNPDITVTDGSPIPGQGDSGTALEFTGSQAIEIPNYIASDASYTISFKMKTTQAGQGGVWFQGAGVLDGDMPGWRSDFGFGIVADGYLEYGEGEDGQDGVTKSVRTSAPVNDGQWHTIALIRDKGVASLYMDSKLQNTAPCFTTPRSATDSITIGSLHTEQTAGRHYVGLIDDVRFYDGVVYPLQGLANVAKTGRYEDLVDWQQMSKYDYIVDGQAKWDAMVADNNWLGAKRILITSNLSIAFNAYDDAIVIPSTVECIDGTDGAIQVSCNYGGGGFTMFKFATKPTNFSMGHLNINCNLNATSSSYLFSNLVNIHDCVVQVEVLSHPSYTPLYAVFYGCDNLTNVRTTVHGSTSWSTHNQCFVYQNCDNLTNCYGYGDGSDNFCVYGNCTNLNGCEAVSSDDGYSGATYGTSCVGYYNCENLANCTGTLEIHDQGATGAVYSGVQNLANCAAVIDTKATSVGSIVAKGFNSCAGLANCVASQSGTANALNIGYNSCAYANGCRKGTFTGTLWSGTTTKRDDDSCDLE